MKRKFRYLTLLIGLLAISSLSHAKDIKVIPYGPNIKQEGAAAAPKEINHKRSAYFKMPNMSLNKVVMPVSSGYATSELLPFLPNEKINRTME